MRFIQHKREAYWFYRFLSPLYDRWVNPLFWTERMRDRALTVAELTEPGLLTVDVGAGTGFSTEGIVSRVDPANVTLLDQSPDQLGRARRKPALAACTAVLGDAESLPFPTDHFDRYVSCGSIEYWPDPQRAIAEAYRVLKPGGIATVVGPLPPRNRIARVLADLWMLFPRREQYTDWMQRAGFEDLRVVDIAPDWHGERGYGVSIAGRKPVAGESPAARPVREESGGALRFALRFALGSAAGALFVPIGAALSLRARLRRNPS